MKLKTLINKALKEPVPTDLQEIYDGYYSPYYNLMRLLAARIKDGILLELGVHKGRGLASLAAGNKSNFIIGLDTERPFELDEVLARFENIDFVQRPSLPAYDFFNGNNLVGATYQINLLHIDTEHSYSMAKAEFEAYQPFLAKGAYVLFDDLHAIDNEVLRYFESLPYEKAQDDRLHPSCGYGVLIYE